MFISSHDASLSSARVPDELHTGMDINLLDSPASSSSSGQMSMYLVVMATAVPATWWSWQHGGAGGAGVGDADVGDAGVGDAGVGDAGHGSAGGAANMVVLAMALLVEGERSRLLASRPDTLIGGPLVTPGSRPVIGDHGDGLANSRR
jgi:hypothetical protein